MAIYKKDDVIANAKKYGPKSKGKISLFISYNRTKKDADGKNVIDPKTGQAVIGHWVMARELHDGGTVEWIKCYSMIQFLILLH